MTGGVIPKDLIVLVADKNMEATFKGLLSRNCSLGIRQISFDVFVHPNKDPGCRGESDRFLQSLVNQYSFGLVVFDREGSGSNANRDELEIRGETKLSLVGWNNRSAVIVLDPELEIWLWNRSPHVEEALGWRGQNQSLRSWLISNGYLTEENSKPIRPKETLELVLRKVKKPRSSAIYMQIAKNASLEGHQEPAFIKLRSKLHNWFSEVNE
jgi:hypothetical protein